MQKNKTGVLQLFVAFLILAGVQDKAYCFNVSPGRIEVSVVPSKGYEDVLTVRNVDEGTLDIKLRIEDWHKAVEGIAEEKRAEFRWLEIETPEFELMEGQTKKVNFKVRVPKDAKGELNAMVFIDGKPKEIREGSIGINTSIGVPIYVMIRGTEVFKAEVEDLKATSASPLKLTVTIKNSGNVHIRPTGTIAINRKGKKELYSVPLNEYNYPILPNSSRTLEINSNIRLEGGEYIADIKMGYNDKRYRKKIALKIE